MQSVELLVQQFLDDRDALAEGELDALVEALSADSQLAARLKDQLVIDELLAQQLAVDRRHFPAQVRQRIRDAELASASAPPIELAAPVDESLAADLRTLADVEFAARQQHAKHQKWSRAVWLAACALVLAAAAGVWWWQQFRQPLAIVVAVSGEPSIVGRGQPLGTQQDAAIRAGDRLVTRPEEALEIRFTDGTTLQLLGDTSLQLRSGRGGQAKDVAVEWGSIAADVRPQPAGAPMTFETPLAIATVRGTRLRLSADSSRTRLDVLEGVVELVRKSDRKQVDVQAQEFAIATAGEISVKPLAWPVDRRDAIVILETGDPATPCVVRRAATREQRPVTLAAHGLARQNHDFAWVLGGGVCVVPEAGGAVRAACGATGELTIEATITPEHLQQSGPARIITCSKDSHEYNFMLGQEDNRLIFRLNTSGAAPGGNGDIELCRLSAAQPQHVAVCYRSGELVCYLNGRRVHQDGQLRGNFDKWKPQLLLLGNDAAAERNWAGTLEGVVIYDRFLEEEEVARNAQLYRELLVARAAVPQVELLATLVERSSVPSPESIMPQLAALVMCRYRVDEMLRGKVTDQELLVAQWAVLDGEARLPATLPLGAQRRLVIERLGLNPQLAGILRVDEFHQGQDPQRPRYYDVSPP